MVDSLPMGFEIGEVGNGVTRVISVSDRRKQDVIFPGMVLTRVNNNDVTGKKFDVVVSALTEASRRIRNSQIRNRIFLNSLNHQNIISERYEVQVCTLFGFKSLRMYS